MIEEINEVCKSCGEKTKNGDLLLRLEKELNLQKDRMTGSKAQTPGTDAGRTPLKEKGEKW